MRFSGGTPALRSIIAVWTSTAQRTASTTLRNSMIEPSPVRLTDASMMRGDCGIDQIATQPPEARGGAILVRSGEPAVADDVCDQDRRDFSGSRHALGPSGVTESSTKTVRTAALNDLTHTPRRRGMAGICVRREKAALSSGCKSHPGERSSRKQPEQSWR